MSYPALQVTHISKSYYRQAQVKDSFKSAIEDWFSKAVETKEKFKALDDVSFEVKQGEVVGIIGKNGAGKSTLLKLLSGVTIPDEGRIDFYGKPAAVLDIGSGFHPDLTGRENILLSAQLYGITTHRMRQLLPDIVAFSGIGEFIDEPVKNYSSGMYLRLAFALVTGIDADVLIFDEVLSVGDAEFQKKCVAQLEMLKRAGKSIVIVSHNMNDVLKLCDRLLLLEQGKVTSQGSPHEIVGLYLEKVLLKNTRIMNDAVADVNTDWATTSLNNRWIGVTSVKVNDIEVGKSGEIFIEDPLKLEITLQILADNLPYSLGLIFKDIMGTPVFSVNAHTSLHAVEKGTYTWQGGFSANLFNTAVFYVDIALIHDINHTQSELLSSVFYIRFSDKLDANDVYKGRYMGIFRPSSTWQLKKMQL